MLHNADIETLPTAPPTHLPSHTVIATAYSCEPNKGSEPGIGWNVVREAARQHRVTVITRENNQPAIEAELARDPEPNLQFVYFDLPAWARWWKRGTRGLQAYYYLWQIGAARVARRLHAATPFDVAHHVTFGRYWNPSFLPSLGIPFVWGPVGGGESAPKPFWAGFGMKGRLYEQVRDLARWIGAADPAVKRTARAAALTFATTEETAQAVREAGAQRVEILGNAALNQAEIDRLADTPPPPDGPLRFLSVGRLLHWKGFDLGLRAFAEAGGAGSTYAFVGDGPDRARLEALAQDLDVADRVTFHGVLPRSETLAEMGRSHALVHPSLHDSGGWVCIEAMAAGRPVFCLDLGGPAIMVDDETGINIPAESPEQAVRDLAAAMRTFTPARAGVLGRAAQRRTQAHFTWEGKGRQVAAGYRTAVATASR